MFFIKKKIDKLKQELKNLKTENKSLQFMAYHDKLTGAYNRHWFNKHIKSDDKVFLSVADVNDLKIINDKQGHPQGDLIIVKVYEILKNYGAVIRFGGDEFIVISETEEMFNQLNNLNSPLFCTGGVKKDEYCDIAHAIKLADERLYHNKKIYRKNSHK